MNLLLSKPCKVVKQVIKKRPLLCIEAEEETSFAIGHNESKTSMPNIFAFSKDHTYIDLPGIEDTRGL